MFRFWAKTKNPLLTVKVNDNEICSIFKSDLPCEKTADVKIERSGIVEFFDCKGVAHIHGIEKFDGWFHFSVRVHNNLACQADCVITSTPQFDPNEFNNGKAEGIRFQPFFICEAGPKNKELVGKGLFARGLHFAGTITPSTVTLSCECDYCHKSFLMNSFHSGFSNNGYFYSDTGAYTIDVPDDILGCPVALSVPDPDKLAALERRLPKAPDGSEFKYKNPFRCPHCKEAYIDFQLHPEERQFEYYGNYFHGAKVLRFELA